MSYNLTQEQQLQTFLNSLLRANMSTGSWVDFWNTNTPTNRGFQNHMFNAMDKQSSRPIFKQILQQHGVAFEQNGTMIFPENFTDMIPRIVEEFMRRRSPQATEAVADATIRHAVCAGGGAVAEASSPADDGFPFWLERSGWGVPVPKSQQKGSGCPRGGCAVSESSENIPKKCPHARRNCKFHATWGGCRNIHPENEPSSGELPERGGPTIMVCRNGKTCKYGKKCHYPHPENDTCVISSFGNVNIAKVCTFKHCKLSSCPCAHLPEDVIEKALQRKKDAFAKSSRGGVACSAVDCESVLKADLEVASLTEALSHLSIEKPHCGGGARVCDLPTESCSVVEGDLLGLESCSVVEGDLLGLMRIVSLENSYQAPPESAPPQVLSICRQWWEIIDPQTGISYFQNQITGDFSFDRPNFFEDDLRTCALSAVCVVACQQVSSRGPKRQFDAVQFGASCAVVRCKVEQEDESQSQKPTKRSADSDSCTESSNKPSKKPRE